MLSPARYGDGPPAGFALASTRPSAPQSDLLDKSLFPVRWVSGRPPGGQVQGKGSKKELAKVLTKDWTELSDKVRTEL